MARKPLTPGQKAKGKNGSQKQTPKSGETNASAAHHAKFIGTAAGRLYTRHTDQTAQIHGCSIVPRSSLTVIPPAAPKFSRDVVAVTKAKVNRGSDPARPSSKVIAPIAAKPSRDVAAIIKAKLVFHLKSEEAADAWLQSPNTGYPDTALAAIKSGYAELVLSDLESQFGPNSAYA